MKGANMKGNSEDSASPGREAVLLHLFSRSVMSDSFASPWTVGHQAPLSMRFPRQEYWTGVPFPSLGNLLDPGIKPRVEPMSPALAGRFFTTEPPGKPCLLHSHL